MRPLSKSPCLPPSKQKALGRGAEVNIMNCMGKTALMLAEEKGHPDIIEFLKKSGAREYSTT